MKKPEYEGRPAWARWLAVASAAVLAGAWLPCLAASTQLSDTPLANVAGAQVKPNVMLLMDTSPSMAWSHMPDEVAAPSGDERDQLGLGMVGYKSSQCNVLYFNPRTTYRVPKRFDKSDYPTPDFYSAPYDIYDTTSTRRVDLSKDFQSYDDNSVRYPYQGFTDKKQRAYYYRYAKPDGTVPDKLGYADAACTILDTGVSKGQWQRIEVGSSATERENFAIWYTYYRTRLRLIKSAASLAFAGLSDGVRVGFITMEPKDAPDAAAINPANFLPVGDFDWTQRERWYDKLFQQKPKMDGASPAREGLARVGRYYAGKEDWINQGMPATGANDPVKYTCQQNFTIMTTDGYWNGHTESPGGGPVGLDGTTRVGQQDGDLSDPYSARPIYDGSYARTRVQTDVTATSKLAPCNAQGILETRVKNYASTSRVERTRTQITQTTITPGHMREKLTRYALYKSQWLATSYQVTRTTEQHFQTSTQTKQRQFQYILKGTETTGPVQSCDPAGDPLCSIRERGETFVAPDACTESSGGAPEWLVTTCETKVLLNDAPVAKGSCHAGTANGVVTTCREEKSSGLVAPASCVSGTTAGFVTTTCTRTDIQKDVPSPTCTNSQGTAPDYIATSCFDKPLGSEWTAPCTGSIPTGPAPHYVRQWCTWWNTWYADLPAGQACVEEAPSAANLWTAKVCEWVAGGTSTAYVATCVPQADNGNGFSRTCSTAVLEKAYVSACTEGSTNSPSYIRTTCRNEPVTSNVLVGTCTNGVEDSKDFLRTTCGQTVVSGPSPVASCAPSSGTAPQYEEIKCSPGAIPGWKHVQVTTTTVTRTAYNDDMQVGLPSSTSKTSEKDMEPGVCHAVPPPEPKPVTASLDAGCGKASCVAFEDNHGPRGSENSLADVAQYYYKTNLRTGDTRFPVSGAGSVKGKDDPPEGDFATHQHMTTFALALGVSGTLQFRSDYKSKTVTTGDFAGIRSGAKNWPIWPDPALGYVDSDDWNNPRSIDDFWHAAVNGRGQFFSAEKPDDVIVGVDAALNKIQEEPAGAPAAVSSIEPVSGDNFVFTASYTAGAWTGDLQKREIDLSSGEFGSAVTWSAQALLDDTVGAACDNRKIYLLRPGATDNKVNFTWNTRTCDAAGQPTGTADSGLSALSAADQGKYFGASAVALLSQSATMSSTQKTAAAGENLVNYLRGQRGLEGYEPSKDTRLYRKRSHVLGDVINGQPVYVKAPFAHYQDAGYQDFKAAKSTRKAMVYVPGNDGMLHAFYAGDSATDAQQGQEAWAFIPSAVLGNLYKLADESYRNTHQYYVDGTPTVGDVSDGNGWKTILVGGLNKGGKGYYAIDITDPDSPKGLWEFKSSASCYDSLTHTGTDADCDIGYSYGRPVITKLGEDWVVLVTSGYNNVGPGDGRGHLYVLNALTGQIIAKFSTSAGSTGTPSGLAQISAFVDNTMVNNTGLRVYGGDLLGNIWRFDLDRIGAGGDRSGVLIGVAKDKDGDPQPITTAPQLAQLNSRPMVYVATGRLLGVDDLSDKQVQSIYGIVDPLTSPESGAALYPNLRGALKPRKIVNVAAEDGGPVTRSISCSGTAEECKAEGGWVVDLPESGERVNIDMQLQLGTLVAGSNVPQESECEASGSSWLNYLDWATGLSVVGDPDFRVSEYLSNAMIVGLNLMRISGTSGGDGKLVAGIRTTAGSQKVYPPTKPPAPVGKRVSWREIAQ